ncbi:MAG: hypothetical protein IT440_02860 [Phycisphaeraceae bacterium]|nr:hypothetical protein [Phycisphaeraceae bacterium]
MSNDGMKDPIRDEAYKWIGGMVVPLLLTVHGLRCVFTQHAWLPGRHRSLSLHGGDAIAFGIAVLAVALYAHSHYFLSEYDRLFNVAIVGKIVAALTFIAAFGYVIVQVGL